MFDEQKHHMIIQNTNLIYENKHLLAYIDCNSFIYYDLPSIKSVISLGIINTVKLRRGEEVGKGEEGADGQSQEAVHQGQQVSQSQAVWL